MKGAEVAKSDGPLSCGNVSANTIDARSWKGQGGRLLEYACLVIARDRFQRVVVDGEFVARVPADVNALRHYFDSAVAPELKSNLAEALRMHEARRTEFIAATEVERETRKEGPLGNRRAFDIDIVRYPGGQRDELPPSQSTSAIAAEFEFRHRTPTLETFDDWSERTAAESEVVRLWTATFFGVDGFPVELSTDLGDWSHGLPLGGILPILNSLAEQDSWSVLQVNEDKGLYKGADAPDEAYPARVRYTLCRDRKLD